jgi:hypothetical protein
MLFGPGPKCARSPLTWHARARKVARERKNAIAKVE